MFNMKKIIKKIGNSVGIIFNKEEQEINDIKVGNVFEIDLLRIKNKVKEK